MINQYYPMPSPSVRLWKLIAIVNEYNGMDETELCRQLDMHPFDFKRLYIARNSDLNPNSLPFALEPLSHFILNEVVTRHITPQIVAKELGIDPCYARRLCIQSVTFYHIPMSIFKEVDVCSVPSLSERDILQLCNNRRNGRLVSQLIQGDYTLAKELGRNMTERIVHQAMKTISDKLAEVHTGILFKDYGILRKGDCLHPVRCSLKDVKIWD